MEAQLPIGSQDAPGHPVPKDPADLVRFAQSERFQRLRKEVVNNPKALESFLEEVTREQPELMRLITHYQQESLRVFESFMCPTLLLASQKGFKASRRGTKRFISAAMQCHAGLLEAAHC